MLPPTEQTTTELADAAFRLSSRKLILEARRDGRKLVIWQDGAVQEIDPYTLELPAEPALPPSPE